MKLLPQRAANLLPSLQVDTMTQHINEGLNMLDSLQIA